MTNADPWALLRGLFPKWDPTVEESGLFRRAFDTRRGDLLVAAVEEYRTYYRYREPNLGSILTKYAEYFRASATSPESDKDDFLESEEEDRSQFERSNRRISHDLDLLTGSDLELIIGELGKMPSMAMFVGRLKPSHGEWTPIQRGMVWAKADQMGLIAGSSSSTAPQSLSQGQG